MTPRWVSAHSIGVDCRVHGDKIEIEAYYDDDTPAIKAKVQVVGIRDEVVASGFTDDKGRWSCALPATGKYEVRVDAGAGHRAKRDLDISAKNESPPSPNRAEFTRTPWLKVLIGLALIAGGSAAFLVVSWLRRKSPSGDSAARPEKI